MAVSTTVRHNLERVAVWLLAAAIVVLVAMLVGLVPAPDLGASLPI